MTTNNGSNDNGLARRSADTDIASARDSRHALQPRSMKEAYDLAKAIAGTPFAPGMNAQGAFAAIMSGGELGLTAMQSLRAFAIVKGKPTLWADAMVAVVRASGLCESWETIESTPERCEIVTRRVGSKRDQHRVWTRADAERAKLLGSDTWKMYPAQMLRHRCASDLARDVYPDVLLGVYSQEEMRDAAPLRSDPTGGEATFQIPADNHPGVRMADLPAPAQPEEPAAAEPAADVPDTTAPADPPPAPSDLPPEHEAALEEFYARVAEIELPGEAIAVWMKHRAALSVIVPRERENAWKALCSRVEEVGKMKNAKVWLKKAIAEEDARRMEAESHHDPDDDGGPTKPRRGPRRATQGDAAADSTAAPPGAATASQGGPAAWLASEEETTAHAATLTTEWAVQASARKHNAALAATPWGVRVYAQRLQAMGVGTEAQCARYVVAWCHHGPKAAATAQRRAA